MKRVVAYPRIISPKHKEGDVLIVQPDEDFISGDGTEADSIWEEGETIEVEISSPDGAKWQSTAEVVEIDDDDHPVLVMVRVDWGRAVLVA